MPMKEQIANAQTILIPSGRDYTFCTEILEKEFNIILPSFNGRELRAESDGKTFIKAKGKDIPMLIAEGYAECGLVGSDICEDRIPEDTNLLYEQVGATMCSFDLLIPEAIYQRITVRLQDSKKMPISVATSFPKLLRKCINEAELNISISTLTPSGSVEIMPQLGVSEAVADLVEKGETARANGLRRIKLKDVYPTVVWRDRSENIKPLETTLSDEISSIDMKLTQRRQQVDDMSLSSYTLTRLRDRNLAVKKFSEETAEFLDATSNSSTLDQKNELADVIYSALLLSKAGLKDVVKELIERNRS